jgi:hypothetical protein
MSLITSQIILGRMSHNLQTAANQNIVTLAAQTVRIRSQLTYYIRCLIGAFPLDTLKVMLERQLQNP